MEEKKYTRLIALGPALVVLLISSLIVIAEISRNGGDPLALVRIGSQYSEGDPNGTPGYDGQFNYFIAINPDPQVVAAHLDVPAYRYQRILYPILASVISQRNALLIPWSLLLIGVFSLAAGTYAVSELLDTFKVNRWYALVYGLWAGLLLSLVTDLSEPLAFGLVAGALLAFERGRKPLCWFLLALALFAKEVTALFVAAMLLHELAERRWKDAAGLLVVAVLPFLLFQGWLWFVFGEPGIGSGGAMATSFELIPYMGLFRIGAYSLVYLAAMLLVFGPALVLPSIWGVYKSIRGWLAGEKSVYVLALLINALVIAFTPFSTFRETGGILRFACGLVLATLLFSGKYQQKRVLNYSLFWIVLNVFLLK